MNDTPKNPVDMTDSELLEAYEALDAEAGKDPQSEALIAEIARRDLDV